MDWPGKQLTMSPSVQDELLDKKIEKTKLLFYQELARKKRNIKRHWMEINAVTNSHFLQQLPYRAMLNHLKDVTAERRDQLKMSSVSDKFSDDLTEASTTVRADSQEEGIVLEDEYKSLPVPLTT